jgi:hypothetical protein
VSRRLAEKGAPLSEQEAIALGIPAARARALVARQQVYARPAPAATTGDKLPAASASASASVPASVAPGFSEADLDALARRYDEAARATAGGRPAPPLPKIRAMLAKKVPELLAQHGAAGLTFDVAVKDGRVVLRTRRAREA